MHTDFLYHYSVEKYPQILSKVGQGLEPESSDIFEYGNGISFFLEPIPRDIATRYHHEHAFWTKGKRLYEYVIPLASLPEQLPYRIEECPEKTQLVFYKQNWYDGMPVSLIHKYKQQIADLEVKYGYKGYTKTELIAALKNIPKKDYIAEAYRLDAKHPNEEILQKYAACVPHAILHVGAKPVPYTLVQQITLR